MRIFSIIFCVWFLLTAPAGAWGSPASQALLEARLEQQVKQQTAKRAKPAPAGMSARQAQITAALDKVRLNPEDQKRPEHVLFKNAFVQKNTAFTQEMVQKANQFSEISKQMVLNMGQFPQTVRAERPDYGQETKGLPFVYVTDASGHETRSIVSEVQHVLRSVRRANPQARILLALEFAVMTDFATPIRFAGKQNKEMILDGSYEALAPLADELHMDTLALDDAIIWLEGEQYIAYKIGDKLLVEEIPQKTMEDEQKLQQLFMDLGILLNQSTYGVYLRNQQWLRYIQAAKPFYDIVIVYAGQGHIESTNLPVLDLPNQMGQNYSTFNFYTSEVNTTDEEFRLNSYQKLCREKACVPVPDRSFSWWEELALQNQATVPPWAPQPDEQKPVEWDGTTYAYTKTDSREIEKYVKTLAPHTQKELNRLLEQAAKLGIDNNIDGLSFDVFIPDVTQK